MPALNPYFTNTFGVTTTNAFGLSGIPVLVAGQFVYQPSVQRLLQLAANLYDASTTTISIRPFSGRRSLLLM